MYPTVDTSGLACAEELLHHVTRFGNPAQLTSDQGTQFVNSLIESFCNSMRVQQIQTMAYSKEENSIVERANREIMRHLRNITFTEKGKSNWSKFLPIVQRIMNSLRKEVTGFTPSELVYAGSIQLDNHLFLKDDEVAGIRDIPIHEWIKERYDFHQATLVTAQQRQREHDAIHLGKADTGRRTIFAVGEQVLLAYPTNTGGNGRPDKLHTNLTGPYTIESINGKEEYILRDTVKNILIST